MIEKNISNLMKNAEKLKNDFQKAQDEVSAMTVNGESGAGLVKITMNGAHDAVQIALDDNLFEQPKKIIEELITSAINDASKKIEEKTKEKMSTFSSLLNFQTPGV